MDEESLHVMDICCPDRQYRPVSASSESAFFASSARPTARHLALQLLSHRHGCFQRSALPAGRRSRKDGVVRASMSNARRTDGRLGGTHRRPLLVFPSPLAVVWSLAYLNRAPIPGMSPFDSYPFQFLTFVMSVEAIFLSLFILMSSNRSNRQAHCCPVKSQIESIVWLAPLSRHKRRSLGKPVK